LCIAAAGCARLPEPDFAPAEPNLAVMTYNVNWESRWRGNVVRYVKTEQPDVVLLQETHDRWEYELMSKLAGLYPHSVFENPARAGGGFALLSRYPLANIEPIPPAGGWFGALLAEVDSPIGPVQLLNVHLKPAITKRGNFGIGAMVTASRIHFEELKGFLDATDPNKPLIVAGDFNESETKRGVQWLTDQGFDNALWKFDRRSKTWIKPLVPLVTLRNRYDHIMLSPHLQCTGAKVDRVKASDHMPVTAVIIKRPDAEVNGSSLQ
jgi:endonuclease/exonuclease/phosphatase family metal-dependent hydrolase